MITKGVKELCAEAEAEIETVTAEEAINDSDVTKDRYEKLTGELSQALQALQQATTVTSSAEGEENAEDDVNSSKDDDEEVIDADFKPAG